MPFISSISEKSREFGAGVKQKAQEFGTGAKAKAKEFVDAEPQRQRKITKKAFSTAGIAGNSIFLPELNANKVKKQQSVRISRKGKIIKVGDTTIEIQTSKSKRTKKKRVKRQRAGIITDPGIGADITNITGGILGGDPFSGF